VSASVCAGIYWEGGKEFWEQNFKPKALALITRLQNKSKNFLNFECFNL